MVSTTVDRVRQHSPAHANEEIRRQTEISVLYHAWRLKEAPQGHEDLDRRLAALDREWDIERVLEANAATVALIGLGLAATVDRRWMILPAAVAAFLLQHAVQGWCPPVEIFRRIGVRTAGEIAEERAALKALGGDFETVPRRADPAARAKAALHAARS